MNTKVYKKEIKLPDGRIISIETGKLAKQADGSAVIQMGNAMLLATVVSSRTPSPVDFLPLTVDYREKNLLHLENSRVDFLREKLDLLMMKY